MLRVRERIALLVFSRQLKFYKSTMESALIAIGLRIFVIYIINYFSFKNNKKVE